MSQEKAQLIAPQGHFTVPGLNVAGVVTASSFSGNCTGTASSLVKGTNVVVGVMTASSFVGDVVGNVTGIGSNTDNLDVGVVTATSFAGNFTGIGSGLTGTPNVVAGVVTATKFVGNTPGTVSKLADGTNINVGVITATKFVGNTPGLAGGISAAQNINVGVLTATGGLYGDGSGLTGAGTTGFVRQDVTISGSNTTIDLNNGNIIYLTHNADTTLAFSNVSTATDITIIRPATSYTLSWPSGITWNTGAAPTILTSTTFYNTTTQVFNLSTPDGGTTWYGYEEVAPGAKVFELYSWGAGGNGQIGDNDRTDYSSPKQITGTTWVGVRQAAMTYRMAVKTDGTLWTWGGATNGRLGHNTNISYSSPTQIGSGTDWSFQPDQSAIGARNGAAIKTDGTLWSWGLNAQGQIGNNTRFTPGNMGYSSPVQVPGTTWSKIKIGDAYMIALKTNGTMWTWGSNSYGQLGIGNKTYQSSPIQIPGTSWSKITGCGNLAAIRTDGTLWCWGVNTNYGQLGQNNKTNYSSPRQVPGTTWKDVSTSPGHVLAVKTDGTIWSWGRNEYGMLGQSNTTEYSSPKQVGSGTDWDHISAGTYSSYALKTDGQLWVWGRGNSGSLGVGDNTNYSSPKQIPGNWAYVEGISYGGYALKNT